MFVEESHRGAVHDEGRLIAVDRPQQPHPFEEPGEEVHVREVHVENLHFKMQVAASYFSDQCLEWLKEQARNQLEHQQSFHQEANIIDNDRSEEKPSLNELFGKKEAPALQM